MRLFVRYAGGLACLVTALALVACGGGPGSQPEPKQIGNIAFQQGEKVRTIPLSDKFSGADLTYSATTSKRSVATVTVDNDADTLTVTAVAAGTATITVTAENSQGEAKQTFTVTVPKPPAPDPVEIPDIPSLEEGASSRPIPLGDKFSGENLTYATSSNNRSVATATVDNDADTLTVTAVSAGTATITVTATAQGSATQTQTQTFTVTVPQPAAEVTVPTVKASATTAESVAVEATSTVLLSTVFDGATSYRAESRPTTIATASGASSGTLRITGVRAGSATITVTGTNTAGSTAHPIAVTVTVTPPVTTPPTTTPTPTASMCRSLTIDLNRIAKCKLPPNATLKAPPGGGIEAMLSVADDEKKANIWVIRAHKKGTYTVTIFSGDANPVKIGEIIVEVPNSPPTRNTEPDPGRADLSGSPGAYTATVIDLRSYFDDDDDTNLEADPDIEPLRYSAGTWPDSILIDAKDGFLKIGDDDEDATLTFAVLEEVTKDFQVTIHASDDSGEQSQQPVVLTLGPATGSSLMPRGEPSYLVTQKATGELNEDGALKVGPRLGVFHTVTFNAPTGKTGFVFAETASDALIAGGALETGGTVTTSAVHVRSQDRTTYIPPLPDESDAANKAKGVDHFVIESTGAVVLDGSTFTVGETPSVTFQLKKGSSGSIIIRYYVWAGATTVTKRTYPKTLSINVVNCSSPPDPIEDCP